MLQQQLQHLEFLPDTEPLSQEDGIRSPSEEKSVTDWQYSRLANFQWKTSCLFHLYQHLYGAALSGKVNVSDWKSIRVEWYIKTTPSPFTRYKYIQFYACHRPRREKKKYAQKEIFAAVKKTVGPCSTTLVAVLQSLHISHQGHHSGSFVGNQIDKMLKVGLHT